MKQDILRFWQQAQLYHMNPGETDEFPEGWDVRGQLRELVGDRQVADIGCGYGRLCTAFAADRYLGFDVNPSAVETARHRHPEYHFTLMRDPLDYTVGDTALLYTVLLHIHDDDIEATVANLCDRASFIVIAEIMLRSWRGQDRSRPENAPPVFNRDASEYIAMFARRGFEVDDAIIAPYKRYQDTNITFLALARKQAASESRG